VGILTVNEEPKVGHPYTSCDRYDPLVPVPNGDADCAHERMPMTRGRWSYRPKQSRGCTCGVRPRVRQQQRSGTQGSKKKRDKRSNINK
jgi:hypothetical protein